MFLHEATKSGDMEDKISTSEVVIIGKYSLVKEENRGKHMKINLNLKEELCFIGEKQQQQKTTTTKTRKTKHKSRTEV